MLRVWEGGEFPTKQTLGEGLSWVRQWKEQFQGSLLLSLSPWHKDMAPGKLRAEDTLVWL